MRKRIILCQDYSDNHKKAIITLLENLNGVIILERYSGCIVVQCNDDAYLVLDDLSQNHYFIITD